MHAPPGCGSSLDTGNEKINYKVREHSLAVFCCFSVFSHNTAIDMETGYNDEETKVIKELKKIFEDDRIAVRHLYSRAGAARPFGLHDI